MLKAVHRQFQSPPADILAERSVDIFLEDPDFDEDKLRNVMDSGVSGEQVVTFALRSGRPTQEPEGGGAPDPSVGDVSTSSQASYVTASSVMSGMDMGPSGVGTQLGKHPYAKVYESLYYLVAQVCHLYYNLPYCFLDSVFGPVLIPFPITMKSTAT